MSIKRSVEFQLELDHYTNAQQLVRDPRKYGCEWIDVVEFKDPNRVKLEVVVEIDKDTLTTDFDVRYLADPYFDIGRAAEEVHEHWKDQIQEDGHGSVPDLVSRLEEEGYVVELDLDVTSATNMEEIFRQLREDADPVILND